MFSANELAGFPVLPTEGRKKWERNKFGLGIAGQLGRSTFFVASMKTGRLHFETQKTAFLMKSYRKQMEPSRHAVGSYPCPFRNKPYEVSSRVEDCCFEVFYVGLDMLPLEYGISCILTVTGNKSHLFNMSIYAAQVKLEYYRFIIKRHYKKRYQCLFQYINFQRTVVSSLFILFNQWPCQMGYF